MYSLSLESLNVTRTKQIEMEQTPIEPIHNNKIAIDILTNEYSDYPRNDWHYNREYRMICNALNIQSIIFQANHVTPVKD